MQSKQTKQTMADYYPKRCVNDKKSVVQVCCIFAGVERCAKMSKSSSLPVCRQPSPTVHSNSVDLRDNVSASLRDTITSCDLAELPKYLADMYRQQKLERQREQELAARDRERLENIEKMWKELENHLTTTTASSNSATSVTSSTKAEPSERRVPESGHRTAQRKHKQQVLTWLLCYFRPRNEANSESPCC